MLHTAFLSETMSAAPVSITKTRNFKDELLPPPLAQLLMTWIRIYNQDDVYHC